jgi:hypothetical protein
MGQFSSPSRQTTNKEIKGKRQKERKKRWRNSWAGWAGWPRIPAPVRCALAVAQLGLWPPGRTRWLGQLSRPPASAPSWTARLGLAPGALARSIHRSMESMSARHPARSMPGAMPHGSASDFACTACWADRSWPSSFGNLVSRTPINSRVGATAGLVFFLDQPPLPRCCFCCSHLSSLTSSFCLSSSTSRA